jgi:hypothetical protein
LCPTELKKMFPIEFTGHLPKIGSITNVDQELLDMFQAKEAYREDDTMAVEDDAMAAQQDGLFQMV